MRNAADGADVDAGAAGAADAMSRGIKLPARLTAKPIHHESRMKVMMPSAMMPPLPPRRMQVQLPMNPRKKKAPSVALHGGATAGGAIETDATRMDAVPPKVKAMAMPMFMQQARLKHASPSRNGRRHLSSPSRKSWPSPWSHASGSHRQQQ